MTTRGDKTMLLIFLLVCGSAIAFGLWMWISSVGQQLRISSAPSHRRFAASALLRPVSRDEIGAAVAAVDLERAILDQA
jgi:hypothetical protein